MPSPEEARKWGLTVAAGDGLPLVYGEDRRLLDDGDEVSWTAGKETFCPVKFHAFDVGPVTVTTRVRPRETAGEALARAKKVAREAWDAEYEAKLIGHLARVREAAGTVRGT